MNGRVFITDGHWRKSLAAVRALGGEGIKVTVGETTLLATAAFSRYAHQVAVYPSPVIHPEEFISFIADRLSRKSYRMLLPMEDATQDLVACYRDKLSPYTYIPLVPVSRLHLARQKDKVLELARNIGISIPKTWYVETLDQLDSVRHSLPYPVVIKPREGSGAVGVCYPRNPAELKEKYMALHSRFPYPLIQERIPSQGTGYGASFLLNQKGEVKASFVHRRLREYPVQGGASTLRESVIRDDIRGMGEALLKELNWFGVAMVEFKVDPRDGKAKLMEVNPRFWGSLALAIKAGVNFPYLLYRMACGEDFKPVEEYQTGTRCRWLLPGDILHFVHNPKRRHLLPDFLKFRQRNTSYDILSLKDPLPALGRVLTPLTFLYDRDMKIRLKSRKL